MSVNAEATMKVVAAQLPKVHKSVLDRLRSIRKPQQQRSLAEASDLSTSLPIHPPSKGGAVPETPQTLKPVSANNPCPFLRALVSDGRLPDTLSPLDTVARTIVATAATGEGHPKMTRQVIAAIALIANGLRPTALLRAMRHGLRLDALRGGPLDKRGAGSGLLSQQGDFDSAEWTRLKAFATDKRRADGHLESGLGLIELKTFMDANFERARGRRRRVDRALMNGEWPILLEVMGRDGPDGRFLSLQELQELFAQRRLPARMRPPAAT